MRLIDADSLIGLVMDTTILGTGFKQAFVAIVNGEPTIEPERKKGKWIYNSEAYPMGNPYGRYDCDQCGESVPHKMNYCPNCGADMRGAEE